MRVSIPNSVIKKFAEDNNMSVNQAEIDIAANSSFRDSVLTLPDGTQYKLTPIEEKTDVLDTPLTNADGLRRERINHCPYVGCNSDNIELSSVDEFGTTMYKCNSCLNIFKETREGDIYLYDKVKDEWKHTDERMKPPTPIQF